MGTTDQRWHFLSQIQKISEEKEDIFPPGVVLWFPIILELVSDGPTDWLAQLSCSLRNNTTNPKHSNREHHSIFYMTNSTQHFKCPEHFNCKQKKQECLSALCRVTFNIVVYAGNDFNWLLHIYTICNLLWLKNYRMIFCYCFLCWA